MKNRNDNSCTANTLDWNPLADLIDTGDIAEAASPFLETEEYTSHTEYDALNRPISLTTPDGSVNLPTYNEAGLLDKVQASLRGASVDDATPFVTNINYDAKGQRELVEYANGVYTEYTYDPLTFRVIRIHTIRTKDNACLQDLNYTYDPVGNITELRDNAQKTIFYDNARVEQVNHYEYDALYRLIHAEGREHAGQNANAQPGHHNPPIINTPHPNDTQAMRNYTEDYAYDEVGNIKYMDHKFANGGWKRNYEYEELSNRLESTSLQGDDPEGPYGAQYGYDAHGNMTRMMPHLPEMCWDFKDQMCQVDLKGGGAAYYVYDSGGQRACKVHEHNGSTVEERIYLGGYEIYRKHNGTGLTLERETLHIMDDQQRIALVETKTREDGSEVSVPKPLVRYQLNNHLGSSSLELDEDGVEISYEEYYPYGSTSYQAVDKNIKAAAKRYRYTGKERDDETGLYYYGARYYAAWLGRWIAPDPAGLVDGMNLYRYSQNNPVKFGDASGTKSNEPKINNTDISEEYWQDNPNLIWNEESQLYHYTDPNTYGTWIGKEGQWIGYTPAEEIAIKPPSKEEGGQIVPFYYSSRHAILEPIHTVDTGNWLLDQFAAAACGFYNIATISFNALSEFYALPGDIMREFGADELDISAFYFGLMMVGISPRPRPPMRPLKPRTFGAKRRSLARQPNITINRNPEGINIPPKSGTARMLGKSTKESIYEVEGVVTDPIPVYRYGSTVHHSQAQSWWSRGKIPFAANTGWGVFKQRLKLAIKFKWNKMRFITQGIVPGGARGRFGFARRQGLFPGGGAQLKLEIDFGVETQYTLKVMK